MFLFQNVKFQYVLHGVENELFFFKIHCRSDFIPTKFIYPSNTCLTKLI